MTSDPGGGAAQRRAAPVRRRADRRLGLEGRRAFPVQLRSTAGPARRRVTVVSASVAGVVVAIVVGVIGIGIGTGTGTGTGTGIGTASGGVAAPLGVGGTVLAVVVSVLSGVAAAAFVTYAFARVFLIVDARARPDVAWRHDGILVRHTGQETEQEQEPFVAELAGPLAAAADAAEVRMVWGIVIGWAQCVLGAALFVVIGIGMVVGAGVPWILLVITFIVGGLGQDMAARSSRTLGRVAEARRLIARLPHDDEAPGTLAPPEAPEVVGSRGRVPSLPSASSRRTARRMPPRAPGRGSSLELPGE